MKCYSNWIWFVCLFGDIVNCFRNEMVKTKKKVLNWMKMSLNEIENEWQNSTNIGCYTDNGNSGFVRRRIQWFRWYPQIPFDSAPSHHIANHVFMLWLTITSPLRCCTKAIYYSSSIASAETSSSTSLSRKVINCN